MLKGDLANQWSLYTQPFLIYYFFIRLRFGYTNMSVFIQ